MKTTPAQIRPPAGLFAPVAGVAGPEAELHLAADLQTLKQIVAELDGLEERINVSPIPKAVTQRGYFTPDEDDRVRQGVLLYRNCRLMAYDIILRYRDYAALKPESCGLRCFLVAFGAALVLYAKSLRIISFAEHVPLLRAKMNEPDSKYDMPAGFFDDVIAGYSQLCNYRSMVRAGTYWRSHRRAAHALAQEAGGDWEWLLNLVRRHRPLVRHRLAQVLRQRLRHDWRAFCGSLVSPFRQARHGLEEILGERLREAELTVRPAFGMSAAIVERLRPRLKPGDVLLVRDDTRLAAALLPGFWTHAALYLGEASEMEEMGLGSHPHVFRHWSQIQNQEGSMGTVIEALAPCVQLNPLEKCLAVSHLVILRPVLSRTDIAAAIGEALGHLGKPYDFDFNFNNSSRVVCTELIYRSYHSRGSVAFSLTKRLGRFTLTGDDIVAYVLDNIEAAGEVKSATFAPIALVLTRRAGRIHEAPPERILPLLRRIRRGWHPSRNVRFRKPAGQTTAFV